MKDLLKRAKKEMKDTETAIEIMNGHLDDFGDDIDSPTASALIRSIEVLKQKKLALESHIDDLMNEEF